MHQLATYLVMALGVVHIALAPVFFQQFTARVMWFVAQGLMAIFLGFLSLVARRAAWRDRVVSRLCRAANSLAVIFIILYLLADHDPPSFIAAALFGCLLITSLLSKQLTKELL